MERVRTRLYAGMALCGLLMIGLSFLPWIRFQSEAVAGDTSPLASVMLSGSHTSRWRDLNSVGRNDVESVDGWCSCHVTLGDGYLTAAFGLMVTLVAAAGWWTWRDRAAAMAGVVASFAAFGLAGFDAIAKWNAYIWTEAQDLEIAHGTIQLSLIALLIVGIAAAVLSGAIWSVATVERLVDEVAMEQENEMADEETNQETEAWA